MVLDALLAVLAAMAAFAVVIILIGCILFIHRRREKTRPRHLAGPVRQTRSARDAAELSSILVDESATFDPSLRISMAVIVEATRQFSPDLIVGDGGFGLVYKAQLSPGVTVAIKKLSPDAFQGFREFRAEMETLGRLKHQNIVKMLGYCVSNTDRLLVYEFIEKGSLDLWLQDSSMEINGPVTWPSQAFEKFVPLSWPTRIKIMQGVAAGLAYLHGLQKPIIHRDIKASNVLLDRNFEAHIADFGLARRIDSSHTHVSTQVAGTMGYMPPEYKAGLTLATVEADVYSFGILMFEVATGKQPNLPISMPNDTGPKPKEVGLIEWARLKLKKQEAMEMIDPIISREAMVEAQVTEYFRIASLCTEESAKRRPAMTEVQYLLDRVSSV